MNEAERHESDDEEDVVSRDRATFWGTECASETHPSSTNSIALESLEGSRWVGLKIVDEA